MVSLALGLAAAGIGVGIGVVLQKSRLCHASMLSDLMLFRTLSPNGKGLLVATGLTMFAWSLIYAVRGSTGFWLPAWGWYGLAGGAIFGVGMITASGCMMSALYRAAAGDLQYVLTLLWTGAGYLAYGLLYPVFLEWYFTPLWIGTGGTLFGMTPVPGPVLAVFVLGCGLFVYAWFVGWTAARWGRPPSVSDGGPKGGPRRVDTVSAVTTGLAEVVAGGRRHVRRFGRVASLRRGITASWDPRSGGVVLAVLAASWLWLHGVWTVSGPEAGWVALAVDAAGITTPALEQWERAMFGSGGLRVSANMVVIGGAGTGAVFSAVVGGEFRIRWPPRETVPYASVGGFLMGVGASLAPGCNIGNMFTGIAQLSVHGVVASAGMVLGAYLATRWLF